MDRLFPKAPSFMRPTLKLIGKHLANWPEAYLVLPLTLLSVIGAAYFSYFLTGRAPQDSGSWLLDYSARCIVIALAITFTSAARQAYGVWLTLEQKLEHPGAAAIQSFLSFLTLLAFLYTLSH